MAPALTYSFKSKMEVDHSTNKMFLSHSQTKQWLCKTGMLLLFERILYRNDPPYLNHQISTSCFYKFESESSYENKGHSHSP